MIRTLIVAAGLLAGWEVLVLLTGVPPFILPPPSLIAPLFASHGDLLLHHAAITVLEIVLGLAFGVMLGLAAAISMMAWPRLRDWALPLLVISQAIPVFAIAPLLVLWLGYGLASKVAMASLIIFFPVASALFDGLRRTDPEWLALAQVMNAPPHAVLLQLRLPSALPSFGSGLRVAASVAPIGAVVGEWVGASAGLGYLMMQQLARGQTPLAFAALLVLCVIGVALYHIVDLVLRRTIRWSADSLDTARSDLDRL